MIVNDKFDCKLSVKKISARVYRCGVLRKKRDLLLVHTSQHAVQQKYYTTLYSATRPDARARFATTLIRSSPRLPLPSSPRESSLKPHRL